MDNRLPVKQVKYYCQKQQDHCNPTANKSDGRKWYVIGYSVRALTKYHEFRFLKKNWTDDQAVSQLVVFCA